MPQYGDVDYWEARYASSPEAFDWYQGWLGLRPLLLAYLPPDAPILQVGVGTSRLQEGMALCGGYKCVVNVDYSCTAIESMRLLHADVPQLTYLQADARNMPEFEDGCFAGA